jgi:hypothetical protein
MVVMSKDIEIVALGSPTSSRLGPVDASPVTTLAGYP